MKQVFPKWIRRQWPSGDALREVKALLGDLNLHTVCQSGHCPNQAECWSRRTATFMIMGNTCTRNCAFCAVNNGLPQALDPEEAGHVAQAVARLQLRHVVLTSVTRDDLDDHGAAHFAATIRAIKAKSPQTSIEALTPDFASEQALIATVMETGLEVFSHNIETVKRLHPSLRDARYAYAGSLKTLQIAAALSNGHYIKSGFMVGCGESFQEVEETLADLLAHGCQVVSIGQYLQPTKQHRAVDEFVEPSRFKEYEELAYAMGFHFAVAGPFVRSSYRSEALFEGKKPAYAPVDTGHDTDEGYEQHVG